MSKKSRAKKAISTILAVALVASMTCANTVVAGDTLPYLGDSARGENQPFQHGYRSLDLKNWSSETDPFAEFMRAKVPLQQRNDAFASTQANPKLNDEVEMFTLAGDYGNAFFDSYSYTNEFSQYLFNYWQYADYYGSWHGMPTEEVPEELYKDERGVSDAWRNREFEFGVINMPNPGYTNAAHKNGVKSIGCIFIPRTGQKHSPMLEQDANGNFPIADKLVEMCNWYGFDGWFVNQEEDIPIEDVPLYKAFMKQMRDKGVYIQWYDSVVNTSGTVSYQDEFNVNNSPFIAEKGTQYSDSIFLNYNWNKQKLVDSANHAKSLGIDPTKAVFAGVEAGMDRWGSRVNMRNNVDESGNVMNAIATLGADFVHAGLDEDLENGMSNNIEMRREKDEYQWMTFERERRWWSGPYQDPSKASFTVDSATYKDNLEIGIGNRKKQTFDGVAAYIAERSVINGNTFVTNFNTGHGLEYNVDGKLSNAEEWSNINIQDILPTWQWWFDTEGTALSADFDYGSKYQKMMKNKTLSQFDYELVGGYRGGSSLAVYGNVDAENFLRLYKTDLEVSKASQMQITFKKTSNDATGMKLGVIFEDNVNKVVKLDIKNSVEKSDKWITSTVDLSQYADKKIAAFGLVFEGNASDYQMNIGQMKYTNADAVIPNVPTGFKIDKAYETKEMTVSWNIAEYDAVKQYNLYAVNNGKEIYLGGIYDNHFYIKALEETILSQEESFVDAVEVSLNKNQVAKGGSLTAKADVYGFTAETDNVVLMLKAVSEDGSESQPVYTTYDYGKTATNIAVTPSDGKLEVTWVGGQADIIVCKEYSDDSATYTASGNGSATVVVPTGEDADFARYTMQIKLANGEVATYDGRFDDNYCAPHTATMISTNGILPEPEPKDWWKLHYTVVTGGVDESKQTITRGVDNMPQISASADGVKVVLEDYRGNKSEEVFISYPISITPTRADVQPGGTFQFTAVVKDFSSDDSVTWSVEGSANQGTTISNTGLLTVAADETATTLTVFATSVENAKIKGKATVNIVVAPMLLPATGSDLYKGTTEQMKIMVGGVEQNPQDFTWTLRDMDDFPMDPETTIDENGLLKIKLKDYIMWLEVTATSKVDSTLVVKGEYFCTKPMELTRDISGSVPKGSQVNYKVKYKGTEGDINNFDWTVRSNNMGINASAETRFATGSSILVIAADEPSSSLKVKVAKKDTPELFVEETVYLSDPVSKNNLAEQPLNNLNDEVARVSVKSATTDISMKLVPSKIELGEEVSQEVIWKLDGNMSKETKIDSNGKITVAKDETAKTIKVIATSVVNQKVFGDTTFNVTSAPPISGGGGTGGGSSTPDVDVSDKGDTTEVTVTTPDVYVSGDRVEVLVPDIDVSNATSAKPVEVKIDVPTNSLVNAIKDAQGSSVSIDVVLPRELVNAANVLVREINAKEEVFTQARESGKDIVVNIKSEDGAMVAIWTFKANGITRAKDTNLSVMLKNSSALNSTAKFGDKAAVVNFRHNGTLPSTANVKLNVKSYFKAGDKLTLYYDDTATGQLLKMGKEVVVDSDGNATISIAHCSNYVLVKSDITVDTPSTSNPQTGESNPLLSIIFVLSIIGLGGLCIGIKHLKKDK